jgi:anti-sigma B factor antagonist
MTISLPRPTAETETVTTAYPAPRISLTTVEGVAFLHAEGDIDLAVADNLRTLGDDAISDFIGTIRVDLSQVTFMDSTGLAALVGIRNAALAHGRVLILQAPSERVRKILDITKLSAVFTIED